VNGQGVPPFKIAFKPFALAVALCLGLAGAGRAAATFTPTPTPSPSPTPTVTPSMPLVKSASVSTATIGQTVTFCMLWTNDSSATQTMNLWDSVPSMLTYLGSSPSGSVSAGVVSWSFSAGSGSGGTDCFWGVVSGYPQ
jgi:uncharacterized repeat protein (TIGR01451 family)